MGALHYITPERRARAARTVRDGVTVSCSLDFPVVPSVENPMPAQHHMLVAGDALGATGGDLETALDYIGISFHGMATSHIDALCHVFVAETMYNGYPASDVKSIGAMRNDIMVARDGITGRGVLLDVPRLHGRPWLELDERIRPADLEAAERAQRVRVEEGDILLVSTGRDARRAERGPWSPNGKGLAGLHPTLHPVAPRAPDRGARQRRHLGRAARPRGPRLVGARAPVLPRGDGRPPARQPRPLAPLRGVRRARALGVPVRGGAAARARRDRLAGESDRDLLTVGERSVRPRYSSTCAPSSTTRFGGTRK